MEKVFCWFFVFVLAVGFVAAAEDGWGDINVEGEDSEKSDFESGDVSPPVSYEGGNDVSYSSGDGEYYTSDFYFALGLGIVVLMIIGFFIWLFVRGPKNKWD